MALPFLILYSCLDLGCELIHPSLAEAFKELHTLAMCSHVILVDDDADSADSCMPIHVAVGLTNYFSAVHYIGDKQERPEVG